ncbi:MAG: cation:proton antiporter [Chloroflexi bacterium]|nr:cation:proton antiporter [Chloroflexota bacterium]
MDVHSLLVMVTLAIVVGTAGYTLADKLRIPAIVVLLLLGLLVGPEVLNLVNPAALGDGLRVLVSIAVAIIVFEGGMLLDFDQMRAASPPIRNLMTIGVIVSVSGGTLAAGLLAGLPLPLAALYGALMCVTGPTVVTPLLKRANVNRRLQTILQSEAVLVDAIGAVLAVVVLEFLLDAAGAPLTQALADLLVRLGAGVAVGLIGGYAVVRVLRALGNLEAGTVRLASLGGALAVYALAEVLQPEAGIAAVALAGIVVGNLDIPYADQIHRFKGDLTNLGIALLFILLAAGLRFETLAALGIGGVLAVTAMMLLVRPASVFASMVGTNVPRREQLYIAALGPRGVVAASVATFAGLELAAHGFPNSDLFIGLVFMTIIGTVVIQGLYAKPLAQRLGVRLMQVIIVSADAIARELAARLIAKDYTVSLIDSDEATVAKARADGLNVTLGDGTDPADLSRAGLNRLNRPVIFVAATSSDRTNLLACQVAIQQFGVKDVVARVNSPSNLDNFTALGIRVVSPVVSTAMLLDNLISSSSTMELLTGQSHEQEIYEAVLQNQALANKPLKDWALGDALVILVRRNGQLLAPHGNTTMKTGDVLTLIGKAGERETTRQMIEGI